MRFDYVCTEEDKNIAVKELCEDYNPCIGCIRRNCKGCEFSKGGQDFDNDGINYNS